MPISSTAPLGMANRFTLKVHTPSEVDLGSWTKVAGLDVTWDIAEYRAGDYGNDRWYQPGNTKYSEVSLGRAACADSVKVQAWLSDQSFKYAGGYTATITLKDAHLDTVIEWELREFMPKKWAVDGFEAGKSAVAVETFSFTHMGFLQDLQKPA